METENINMNLDLMKDKEGLNEMKSGGDNPVSISDVSKKLLKSVDAVVDGGKLHGGGGSRVVEPGNSPVRIIKEGAIPSNKILSVVHGQWQ